MVALTKVVAIVVTINSYFLGIQYFEGKIDKICQ